MQKVKLLSFIIIFKDYTLRLMCLQEHKLRSDKATNIGRQL